MCTPVLFVHLIALPFALFYYIAVCSDSQYFSLECFLLQLVLFQSAAIPGRPPRPCVCVSVFPCVRGPWSVVRGPWSVCTCVRVSVCPCVRVSVCPCVRGPCVRVSVVRVSVCPCVRVAVCPCGRRDRVSGRHLPCTLYRTCNPTRMHISYLIARKLLSVHSWSVSDATLVWHEGKGGLGNRLSNLKPESQ